MYKLMLIVLSLIIVSCGNTDQSQKLYNISEIPIVDMHTHLTGKEDFKYCVKTMDEWGGTISVSVNSNSSDLWPFIEDSLDNRILMCQRNKFFTPEEIVEFKRQKFSGIKTHLRYHTLPSELSHEQIDKMGEVGLPYIAMHIADPPEDVWHVPDKFMVHQQDAERVVRQHPNTTFIFAHGFYLTNRDADIDTLRKFFDRNPNLYVDICCSKWWDAPQPGYKKLRQLLIEYKDRFLLGTDFNNRRSSAGFKFLRERLETDKPLTFGNNGGPGPGLALPLDVLNRIYYWNAVRLIPGVKEALIKLGYKISDVPPKSSPIIPDLNYDPPQVKVLDHPEIAKRSEKFQITVDLSAYNRMADGWLEIRDYGMKSKKKLIQTIFKGKFDRKMTIDWDFKDAQGTKVSPGLYRVWLILETNKCAETLFEVT
jgi:hypothetical protein